MAEEVEGKCMNSEKARAVVLDGLQMKRHLREEAKQEAQLEAYERDMIATCNDHCADAKVLRLANEQYRIDREQMAAEKRQQREAMLRSLERDAKAADAVRAFVFVVMVIMLVTVWTPFTWWAAVALTVGLAVCLGAYIFRIYVPWEA